VVVALTTVREIMSTALVAVDETLQHELMAGRRMAGRS